MSSSSKPRDSGIVPLQPVDVGDRHGLRSAVYAINALCVRSGKQELELSTVRPRVAALIAAADADKLSLLLQEWYMEHVDATAAKTLLTRLPAMIESDDVARYEYNPVVNDIEWSALATIYRCCIAVKFLTHRKEKVVDPAHNPGWKIAVPTPKIFGLPPLMKGAPAAGSSCVFMVCHSSAKLSTYVALIPQDQKIFAPGRALFGNNSVAERAPPTPVQKPAAEEAEADSGATPSVKFEGYVTGEGEGAKNEKRVTFAEPAEEPTVEEPTAQEPAAEEPTAEEPTAEEPTAEEPTAEEPTAEEPAAKPPTAEPPIETDPVAARLSVETPAEEAASKLDTEQAAALAADSAQALAAEVAADRKTERATKPGVEHAAELAGQRAAERAVEVAEEAGSKGAEAGSEPSAATPDTARPEATRTECAGASGGNEGRAVANGDVQEVVETAVGRASGGAGPRCCKGGVGGSGMLAPPGRAGPERVVGAAVGRKAGVVGRASGGGSEVEIGELVEATVLFERVYGGGARRATVGVHGKVLPGEIASVQEVIGRVYSAVH